MTVKELKEKINNIDTKYDNLEIVIDDPKYDEYCLGYGLFSVKNLSYYEIIGKLNISFEEGKEYY